jgi:hypothetical protein
MFDRRRWFGRCSHRRRIVAALILAIGFGVRARAQDGADRTRAAALSTAERTEGAAILNLADAAMRGKPVPSDFSVQWHADFLKAQEGTFVPFILTINGPSLPRSSALLYVRAVARKTGRSGVPAREPSTVRRKSDDKAATDRQPRRDKEPIKGDPEYPVDVVFPIEFTADIGLPARIMRGFLVAPGEYDLYVVLRERPVGTARGQATPRATVATVRLSVPDFWTGELAISSVLVADRLTVVPEAPTPEKLLERPYVIGLNDLHPVPEERFRQDQELICVFLVYNPKIAPDRNFDVEVEYHFFRKNSPSEAGEAAPGQAPGGHPPERAGERYINHTDPQRFTAGVMGPQFDPSTGQPIMAGQGVPLAGFQEGEYRLMIMVTDLVAGRTLTRDVNFTVGS